MTAVEDLRAGLIPVVAAITDDWFLDTVTIKERGTPAVDSVGQETQGSWDDVSGLTAIRALIQTAAEYTKNIKVGENITVDVGDFVIILGSYQTGIDSKMRAVSGDGVEYEIFGIENDPVNLLTRLYCHLSDPGTASS